MEYISNTTEFQIKEPTVISLGKFDGIHRGHEWLMGYLAKKKKSGLKTVIFTFDIPPRKEVEFNDDGKVLTTNQEKMHLFEALGIDYLIECPFTPEIMGMEAEDFISMMAERLQVKCMVVGTDFRFGHKRRGNYQMLLEYAQSMDYEVEVVEKVKEFGRDISSTFVREEIIKGNIEKASHLLGYHYFVEGRVIHGNKIGASILEIPTLNINPSKEKLLPPFGVYVTRTKIGADMYPGITNVGCKPTIEGDNPVGVETHLFDFDQDVYGADIKVEFLTGVREEKKFASIESLKAQMAMDVAVGKRYYANVTKMC